MTISAVRGCRDCGAPLERSNGTRGPNYCEACRRRRAQESKRRALAGPKGGQYRLNARLAFLRRKATADANRRAQQRRDREACFQAYGGTCACCGEARYEFLALDHANGGGRRHRATTSKRFASWLIAAGFPDGYRVLCHNCNSSLGFYGYCPHGELVQARTPERDQLALELL